MNPLFVAAVMACALALIALAAYILQPTRRCTDAYKAAGVDYWPQPIPDVVDVFEETPIYAELMFAHEVEAWLREAS